jgi:hypothetical protein
LFLKEKFRLISSEKNVVFVSHFLNVDFIKHKDDFYFYDLPWSFQESKFSSVILYINYTNKSNTFYNNKFSKDDKIVLPKYLSIFDELKIKVHFIKESISLLISKSSNEFNKKLRFQAAVEFFSPSTFFNYRMALMIDIYSKKKNTKYVFTTYEGHPWERLIFCFSKKNNPKIKTVGYQHAIFFKRQHAIKRLLTQDFDPDIILCSGQDAKEKFISSNFIKESNLLIFGTKRVSIEKIDIFSKRLNSNFLILMEGDLIECLPLIDLTVKLSHLLPLNNFILRFHPITSLNKVKSLRPILNNLPNNLLISKSTLEEDFLNSSNAIYRGSTTIIKAIQYGLFPIYYSFKNEMSIDPLFSSTSKDRSICIPEDIFNFINMSKKDHFINHEELLNKISTILSPLDYTIIDKIKSL